MSSTIQNFSHKVSTDTVKKFSYFFDALTYARITSARRELLQFLEDIHISRKYASMFALSMTEILTNLVKHPSIKPRNVYLSMELQNDALCLDIADDASVFADFDAKCKTAIQAQVSGECPREGGYGLVCILRQHADVRYIPQTVSQDSLNHFIIRESFQDPYRKSIVVHNKKKTVFVVDDDPVVLKIQAQMLEEEYDVVTFQDARAALIAFQTMKPGLIISDLNMPEMDGIAFRQSLHHMPGGEEIPFIFLSGHENERSNYRINQLGIDDFLTKPITKENLLAVTDRLIVRAEQIRAVVQKTVEGSITDILKPALPASFNAWHIKTFNYTPEAGGGDFILYDQTPDRLFAVLADVMGHGTQSKFFACAYAGYVRSIFKERRNTTAVESILDAISNSIEGDSLLEMTTMTCQAFMLKPGGTFRVASAGHPPPIHISKGECSVIQTTGPMPGMIGRVNYKGTTITLSPGDKILLSTDGLFTAFDFKRIDYEPVIGFLKENAGDGLNLLYDRLVQKTSQRLEAEDKSPLKDDITFILVEYKGA